jgi:hypothetical protein
MRPRTILGTIDGNRGVGNELTPNQRGKIEGAVAEFLHRQSSSFVLLHYPPPSSSAGQTNTTFAALFVLQRRARHKTLQSPLLDAHL